MTKGELKQIKEAVYSIRAYLHQLQTARELHPSEYDGQDAIVLIESIREKLDEEFTFLEDHS